MCGMCVGTGTGTQEFNQQLNTLVEPNIKHLYIDIYIYQNRNQKEQKHSVCVPTLAFVKTLPALCTCLALPVTVA